MTSPEAPTSQKAGAQPGQNFDRRRFDRQVRFGRILGLLFCVAGFTTIGFGWNGSAKTALVDKQFPYLISGGATGVALVVLGVGLLVMAQLRSERLRLADDFRGVGKLISRAIASAPGVGSASMNGRVVAGKATYHRRDCRLVEGKSDLDLLTIEAARASGLTPCRVCDPQEADLVDGASPAEAEVTAAGKAPDSAEAEPAGETADAGDPRQAPERAGGPEASSR
jgi:hypothetical protein